MPSSRPFHSSVPSLPTTSSRPSTPRAPKPRETPLQPPTPPTAAADSAPPPFNPFFTLITSPTTTEDHHHPTTHYLFSDDDPNLLISTLLHNLSPPSASGSQSSPHPTASRPERYVLADMDANGTKVVSAQSLSPEWAVVGAEVGKAPMWDGGEQGLMLRVEGVGVDAEGLDGEGGVEELVGVYGRRMEELRRVVEGAVGDGGGLEGEGEKQQEFT